MDCLPDDMLLYIKETFYDYDDLKNFAIVYKPRLAAKNLYFEFKNVVRQRLSIPLDEVCKIIYLR